VYRPTRFGQPVRCIRQLRLATAKNSASVVLSWCTLWHFSGDNRRINRPLYVFGNESYRIPRNDAK